MQKFEIEIKNEKIKSYKIIALLMVGLNTLLFIFLLFTDTWLSALISLCFIALYTGYRIYVSKKKRENFFFNEWIFFLLMILWVNDSLVFAIVNLVLFLLYTISLQPIIYDFEASFIKQKKFPWKKYEWNELNNVILKDNLLTIDFKNNRIVQAEIMNQDINEDEFNAFTKRQLIK